MAKLSIKRHNNLKSNKRSHKNKITVQNKFRSKMMIGGKANLNLPFTKFSNCH